MLPAFVPDFSTILQFSIAIVIIAITPGPDMTLFVGRALSEGRAAGLAAMFGGFTGCLVHTSLVVFGLSALIVASPEAFLALKVAGAGYLVWLAWQAVRHGSAFAPEKRQGRGHTLMQNYLTGIGINLLNPKIILFFMTFLPQFVRAGDPHAAAQLVVLGLLFIAVALAITVPMVFAADRVTGALRRRPRIGRALDWLFASVFAAFAAQLLLGRSR